MLARPSEKGLDLALACTAQTLLAHIDKLMTLANARRGHNCA